MAIVLQGSVLRAIEHVEAKARIHLRKRCQTKHIRLNPKDCETDGKTTERLVHVQLLVEDESGNAFIVSCFVQMLRGDGPWTVLSEEFTAAPFTSKSQLFTE